ncbi:MAG: alpha/beta hydrolase [Betaproteobacteria bacterium]
MSTWILLRGLMRESRHWGDFPGQFRRAVPDADVVALDLPGNGRLCSVASPSRVGEMTEFCRANLLQRGICPPYHLLAMSMGAMVALDWAAKYPEELGGCVLINTSVRPFSPFFHRLRPENYPALIGLALLGGSAHDWEATIFRLTSKRVDDRDAIVRSWIRYRCEHPVSRRNALRQLLAAARYRAPADRPVPRLLILGSAGDALVSPRCSRRLALRWRTAYAEHPDAGHDIPLDDGAWVIREIQLWLQTG